MTTLNTPPLSTLLAQLFAEAETMDTTLRQEMEQLPPAEREALVSEQDYRGSYFRLKDYPLAVSKETGALCYLLARACHARSIIEFGTSIGISTLHLAAALKDNGGGCVIGSEFEPSKVVRARKNMVAAGLSEFVEIREGDALETLAHDLPDEIDLVLLDGAKGLYLRILSILEPAFHAGTLVIADNSGMSPGYLKHVRAGDSGYLSVPFADDVELSMKIEQ